LIREDLFSSGNNCGDDVDFSLEEEFMERERESERTFVFILFSLDESVLMVECKSWRKLYGILNCSFLQGEPARSRVSQRLNCYLPAGSGIGGQTESSFLISQT
jgi:hypothetical protein